MIIEFANFLSQCPVLDGEKVSVNYLDEAPGAYSVVKTGEKIEKKKYADGGTLYGQKFLFSLRAEYAGVRKVNISIARHCREIEEWIESSTAKEEINFDKIGAAFVGLKIVKQFVPVATGSIDARYEAEIEVSYYVN